MANENALDRVCNAWLCSSSHKQIARYEARAKIAYRSQQDALDDVSGCLRSIAGSPRQYRTRESPAFPPMRIATSQVQNGFITADTLAFTSPVRSDQSALTTCCASLKEL